jgi:acetyltransferase-like isoleucine patch superfamily enzyme
MTMPLHPAASSEPRSPARDFIEHVGGAPNAHRFWYAARREHAPAVSFARILFNYCAIYAAKHCPSLAFKRWLFRALGMKLGANVTIASGVTLDYFFPELIEIGDDTIVGMDCLLLTHEFLHDRYRVGQLRIGRNVLIGAGSTILAGITIGDDCTISAMSFVNRSIPAGTFVSGNPATHRRKDAR